MSAPPPIFHPLPLASPETVIPVLPRDAPSPDEEAGETAIRDARGRPLRDLRISVTDRCNFRCTYCMPRAVFGPKYPFLPPADLLSFPEIERLARVFAGLGVRKLRLTGGEPLLRKGLPDLVARLAAVSGIDDLTLTTNGALLARQAQELKAAGLHRVTVSLDALDPAIFRQLSDTDNGVATPETVLEGIDAAARAGLGPVKVNAVVRRGVNESELVPLARRFQGTGHILRFIEYMDVGATNGWRRDEVVTAEEIRQTLADANMPTEELPENYPGEVARRYRYTDGGGEIGIIASVTRPFCGDCTRARLSADGALYTCLFASRGHDLRPLLRHSDFTDNAALTAHLRALWSRRDDRYSEIRGAATAWENGDAAAAGRVEMSHIGG